MRKLSKIFICLIVFIFTLLILTHISNPINDKNAVLDEAETTQIATAAYISPTFTPAPEDIMISDLRFSAVDALIIKDIAAGFPGAVLLVSQGGQTIFHKAYGYLKIFDGDSLTSSPVPMRGDTVFDIASLTKVYATTLAIMTLSDSGKLSIDQYAYEFLPEFSKEEYNKITIRQLLSHTSGLPSDVKFFRPDVLEGEMFYSTDREKTISLLAYVPLENEPGETAKYSDIGYMVLGTIIEEITGMRLDEYVRLNIYTPLGIQDSMSFAPLENGFAKENVACTERLGNTRDGLVDFPGVRTYTLQGEVHDEKAFYSMNSISGHAGLFSDAYAIDVLNQVLLNSGSFNGTQLFSPETVNQFTSIYGENTYQLGFSSAVNVKSLNDVVPEGTLCHTGWTGAFSLIDKKNNLSIVLLTNKRHSVISDGKFEGALFDTGKYYAVVTAVYNALGLD